MTSAESSFVTVKLDGVPGLVEVSIAFGNHDLGRCSGCGMARPLCGAQDEPCLGCDCPVNVLGLSPDSQIRIAATINYPEMFVQ
jgi:hypothetical protein